MHLLLVAQLVSQPCSDPAPPRQGYAYCFVDDVMSAPDSGPLPLVVRTPPGPARFALLRPRAQFVAELLKSVEEL